MWYWTRTEISPEPSPGKLSTEPNLNHTGVKPAGQGSDLCWIRSDWCWCCCLGDSVACKSQLWVKIQRCPVTGSHLTTSCSGSGRQWIQMCCDIRDSFTEFIWCHQSSDVIAWYHTHQLTKQEVEDTFSPVLLCGSVPLAVGWLEMHSDWSCFLLVLVSVMSQPLQWDVTSILPMEWHHNSNQITRQKHQQ